MERIKDIWPAFKNVAILFSFAVNAVLVGAAGLDPAVEELRAVFRPLREQVDRLPDGIGGAP